MEKVYNIYAGINGAGKSTLYQTAFYDANMKRINPDEIVQQFGDWKNESDQITAGKIAVKEIRESIKNGISFNQETTLCGKSSIATIQKAKKEGYSINMHYVGVDSVEIAKERVKQRVFKGGHDIPEHLIETRYQVTLDNLVKAIPLCHKVDIYDNTTNFALVAQIEQGKILWKGNCKWLEPVLEKYEYVNICAALKEGGYEVTEKLVNDVKKINTYFNKNYSVKEIKELYKKSNMLPEKGKELVKHAADDFIEAENNMERIKQKRPVKEIIPEIC